MHAGASLGGPVWWAAVVFFVGAWALAAFVFIDALRSQRAPRLAELPESRWFYVILEGAFTIALLALFLLQVAGLRTPGFAAGVVLAVPVAIAVGIAYLLRAVFPRMPAE